MKPFTDGAAIIATLGVAITYPTLFRQVLKTTERSKQLICTFQCNTGIYKLHPRPVFLFPHDACLVRFLPIDQPLDLPTNLRDYRGWVPTNLWSPNDTRVILHVTQKPRTRSRYKSQRNGLDTHVWNPCRSDGHRLCGTMAEATRTLEMASAYTFCRAVLWCIVNSAR